MKDITERELSERDLLIELKTSLASFKDYAEKKFDSLEAKMNGLGDLKSRVAVLESRAKSSDKFKNMVYGSFIASALSIVSSIIIYFLLK